MFSKGGAKRKPFKPNYDYAVDYNDHFETPLNAYTDILPLLDLLASEHGETYAENSNGPESDKAVKELRKEHIIYDPYYCNGRTKNILRGLGFEKIRHEKRDFYKDIQERKIPHHHTLVTNPPYSDDHKEKCLEFCVNQFREQQIAFFLLIPNYVAARSYYRRILGDTLNDVAYLVPNSEYSYSHPEGTGHEKSPFSSLWFCCIGRERIKMLSQKGSNYRRSNDINTNTLDLRPKFVASFKELISSGVISLQNRPNPRQRKKLRKAAQSTGHATPVVRFKKKDNNSKKQKEGDKAKKRRSNSKYRNSTGKRTKKRF